MRSILHAVVALAAPALALALLTAPAATAAPTITASAAVSGTVVPETPASTRPVGPEASGGTLPRTVASGTTADRSVAATTVTQVERDGATLVQERTAVTPRAGTGRGPTRSDFDGDGRDDIAAYTSVGVVVTYSSAGARDLLYTESAVNYGFGWEMVTGDFDGDGYDDLAVSDPHEPDLKQKVSNAGAVWILAGRPDGLRLDTVRHVNHSSPLVTGTSAYGDWFGSALGAGDITGDGRDELVVGVPFKAVGSRKKAGAVLVLKGGATGIVTAGSSWISQNTAGVPGVAETGDEFGMAVAVGRIDKDRYLDLVVGAPKEDESEVFVVDGVVTHFRGSAAGVSRVKVATVSGRSTVPAARRSGTILWSFGARLAIGDTTGDGVGEVIVGVPTAQVGNQGFGGAVASLRAAATGLTARGMLVLSQRDASIAGAAEEEDTFAASIAVGDVTGDGRADVLVGVPGEDLGRASDAGSVVLLRGSVKGLTGTGSQTLRQGSAGVPGSPQRGDLFGDSVSLLTLDGTAGKDAAVSATGETVGGDVGDFSSGTVTTLLGGSRGLGRGTDVSGRALGVAQARYGRLAHQ